MIARKYHFGGRVQGVGFRYATKQIAKGFDVIGTVRNMDDGQVELILQGEENEVEAFIDEMHNSPLDHHIQEQQQFNIPLLEDSIRGFQIVA